MGYSHFDGNEQDVMEVFLKQIKLRENVPIEKESIDSYAEILNSLLRRKMIQKVSGGYAITERGRSAITQQIRSGEYWVSPLKSKPFKFDGSARIRVPEGYGGYFK